MLETNKLLLYYHFPPRNILSGVIYKGFNIHKWVPVNKIVYRNVMKYKDYIHTITHLEGGSEKVFEAARNNEIPFIFVDNGYMLHRRMTYTRHASYMRIVPCGFQQNWMWPTTLIDKERLKDITNNKFSTQTFCKDWKKNGKHILVVPPNYNSVASRVLLGIHAKTWEVEIVNELCRHTDRPVIVRSKDTTVPLLDHLKNCFCVVTLFSNVAVDAIAFGIPVFCHKLSAAYPISMDIEDLHCIENPLYGDKELWLQSLACGQFNLDEIDNGTALHYLKCQWDWRLWQWKKENELVDS